MAISTSVLFGPERRYFCCLCGDLLMMWCPSWNVDIANALAKGSPDEGSMAIKNGDLCTRRVQIINPSCG